MIQIEQEPAQRKVHPDKRQRVGHNFHKWHRQPIQTPPTSELRCMQLDIDSTTEVSKLNVRTATIRIYGITENGHSVLTHVHGFMPYFYIPCPDHLRHEQDAVKNALEREIAKTLDNDKIEGPFITSVTIVKRSSILGYQHRTHANYFMVSVTLPSTIYACRNCIENGFELDGNLGMFEKSTTFKKRQIPNGRIIPWGSPGGP